MMVKVKRAHGNALGDRFAKTVGSVYDAGDAAPGLIKAGLVVEHKAKGAKTP